MRRASTARRRSTGRCIATTPRWWSCWCGRARTSSQENRYGVRPLWLAAGQWQPESHRAAAARRRRSEHAVTGGETAVMTAARAGNADALKRARRSGRQRQRAGRARADRADVGGGAQQRGGDPGAGRERRRPEGPHQQPGGRRRPRQQRVQQPGADRLHGAAVRGPCRQRRGGAGAARRRRRRQRHAVGRRERAGRRNRQCALGGGELPAGSRRRSERGRRGMERAPPDRAQPPAEPWLHAGPGADRQHRQHRGRQEADREGHRYRRADDEERHEGRPAQPASTGWARRRFCWRRRASTSK